MPNVPWPGPKYHWIAFGVVTVVGLPGGTFEIPNACTSLTDARMVAVRSEMILTLIAGGIEAWSTGIITLIRSTVSMTLAPG